MNFGLYLLTMTIGTLAGWAIGWFGCNCVCILIDWIKERKEK